MTLEKYKLSDKDIRRSVKYIPSNEIGIISSWSNRFIFVRFSLTGSGQACLRKDLIFIDK